MVLKKINLSKFSACVRDRTQVTESIIYSELMTPKFGLTRIYIALEDI